MTHTLDYPTDIFTSVHLRQITGIGYGYKAVEACISLVDYILGSKKVQSLRMPMESMTTRTKKDESDGIK
jgi:hypothetical protein